MNTNDMNAIGLVFACIGAVAGVILGIIYGILALIPAAPFDHAMITLGVVLIVLSIFGITGLIGYIVGYIIGMLLYVIIYTFIMMPISFINSLCKREPKNYITTDYISEA